MVMATKDEPAVDAPVDARTLLPLPSLDHLVEQQVRGYVCVWGGEQLANETAVNLGPRTKKRLGGTYQIFPRACPACTRDAAARVLRVHRGSCEQCTDDASVCSTRAALEQLARDGR
jgi:hypothetical protein